MGYGQRQFDMRLINKVLLFTAAMAVSSSLKAQGGSGQNFSQSPYSNFGVGEWTGMNFTQAGANMHTFSGAYSHSLTNPATLGNLRYAAFNMGVASRGMQYLSLGYPTWTYDKRIKLEDSAGKKTYKSTPYGILSAISLSPLTTVGYRYAFENNEPFLNRTTHTGSGGLNNLQWSHAGRLGKNWNLGYSVGHIFGQLKDKSIFTMPDSLDLGGVEDSRSVIIKGMQQQVGFMWQGILDSNTHRLGASYTWYSNVNAERNRLTRSFEIGSSGGLIMRDTILNSVDQNGTVFIPASFGVGYQFQYRRKWSLALDYRYSDWGGFQAFFDPATKYAFRQDYGLTFTLNPSDEKARNERKMPVPVRLGGVWSETQQVFTSAGQEVQIGEFKAFAGFGIPVIRRYYDNSVITSVMHVQAQYLQRGSLQTGLAQERYFQLNLGFQLGDKWFQRRKFD
jgi:hypothetical protein